ncbi:hypothetical protein NMK71_11235 [Weeksellaceae bacterium KMM 9713]|uniref:Uncharacterized protein n=1 Tax=Profundicola chukchiensis TaxID=2961959 RepID=A0A9X4N145_9FLAO|nr:hypothetical protein [Profundicola chukchiensis]MDG4946985.1 hypothetical protein [Profundicola chukchiensis]MDG4949307.1 hypothetical protein [Profundicola chukchiensis]
MRIFLLCLLWFGTTSFQDVSFNTVYICNGKSSKKYHLTPNCRGLSNCSTKIYKVTKDEARRLNRTLCGWED